MWVNVFFFRVNSLFKMQMCLGFGFSVSRVTSTSSIGKRSNSRMIVDILQIASECVSIDM